MKKRKSLFNLYKINLYIKEKLNKLIFINLKKEIKIDSIEIQGSEFCTQSILEIEFLLQIKLYY